MKKTTILLLSFSVLSFAQKKVDVYKKLANSTCECANAKGEATISEMSLGICIYQSLDKLNPKEQKTIGYSTENKTESITGIAENIGTEMVLICPDVFSKLENQKEIDTSTEEEVAEENQHIIGTFDSMISNEFNSIRIIDENNGQKDFIWLFPFEGDTLFIRKKVNKGEKIDVYFREQEFFDPKTNSYQKYNEISEIKLL